MKDDRFVAGRRLNADMAKLAELHKRGRAIAKHPSMDRFLAWGYAFYKITGADSADRLSAFRAFFKEGKK